MKTARDRLDIITAFQETGSYRAAAALCGTTHKTVRRTLERWWAGDDLAAPRQPVVRNIDAYRDLVADKVDATRGRISAKRLLPVARAAGYEGSARNFRRLVAEAKTDWRRHGRVFRPWVHSPGEHLVIDWTEEGRWKVFCAVLPWSRIRFVRFAADMTTDTTLRLLAECFEELGGVPAVCCPTAWPPCAGRSWRIRLSRTAPTCGSRPTTGFDRTGVRPATRSPKGWWSTWPATSNAT